MTPARLLNQSLLVLGLLAVAPTAAIAQKLTAGLWENSITMKSGDALMEATMADRNELPAATEGRCQRETLERSGSTLKFKFTCTDPASTGEGNYSFSSDKTYSGNMVVNTSRNGRDMRMEMQQQGQWLGTDCGALKPRP